LQQVPQQLTHIHAKEVDKYYCLYFVLEIVSLGLFKEDRNTNDTLEINTFRAPKSVMFARFEILWIFHSYII